MQNFSMQASNDAHIRNEKRERTVPIPETIIAVHGYPEKLAIFKIAASKFWQVRCWHNGKTFRKSTKSQAKRSALIFARIFYEQLMATNIKNDVSLIYNKSLNEAAPNKQSTFGALAAKMFANEQAREKRGEYSYESVKVLRNRLDAHLLPRWGTYDINAIDYAELLKFTQELSETLSTITISQYLVIVKKVFALASGLNLLKKMPLIPKIKVKTNSRGSFTPNEYWKIVRCARKMIGKTHPEYGQLRNKFRLRNNDHLMPIDLQWAIRFMLNSFIRPSDLKTLKHKISAICLIMVKLKTPT